MFAVLVSVRGNPYGTQGPACLPLAAIFLPTLSSNRE